MSALMPVCGPVDLKTRGGTDYSSEAPFFLSEASGLRVPLFQATTEPFCGKGFLAQKKENTLSRTALAKPLSSLGKNESVWYFSGLEKNEGPAR